MLSVSLDGDALTSINPRAEEKLVLCSADFWRRMPRSLADGAEHICIDGWNRQGAIILTSGSRACTMTAHFETFAWFDLALPGSAPHTLGSAHKLSLVGLSQPLSISQRGLPGILSIEPLVSLAPAAPAPRTPRHEAGSSSSEMRDVLADAMQESRTEPVAAPAPGKKRARPVEVDAEISQISQALPTLTAASGLMSASPDNRLTWSAGSTVLVNISVFSKPRGKGGFLRFSRPDDGPTPPDVEFSVPTWSSLVRRLVDQRAQGLQGVVVATVGRFLCIADARDIAREANAAVQAEAARRAETQESLPLPEGWDPPHDAHSRRKLDRYQQGVMKQLVDAVAAAATVPLCLVAPLESPEEAAACRTELLARMTQAADPNKATCEACIKGRGAGRHTCARSSGKKK